MGQPYTYKHMCYTCTQLLKILSCLGRWNVCTVLLIVKQLEAFSYQALRALQLVASIMMNNRVSCHMDPCRPRKHAWIHMRSSYLEEWEIQAIPWRIRHPTLRYLLLLDLNVIIYIFRSMPVTIV